MSEQDKPFTEEELQEGKRLLMLLRQLEAAGGVASTGSGAQAAPATKPWWKSLGTPAKVLLAFCLLAVGVVYGITSGAFGSKVQDTYRQEYQRQMALQQPGSSLTDDLERLNPSSVEEMRNVLEREIARRSEDAGLGEEGRELLQKLKAAIEKDQQVAAQTQKTYEDALKQLAEARDAARKRNANDVDVEAAIREVIGRLGLTAEAQDISCLTDPNWDPAKAAAAMVAEQNARRQAQRDAAASAAAAATQTEKKD